MQSNAWSMHKTGGVSVSSRAALRRPIARQAFKPVAALAEGPSTSAQPELWVPTPRYCQSVHQTLRRPTRTVHVGNVKIGSEHRIARQTMTTTDTRNVEKTVAQVKKCADSGADLVRITVQGKREAEACMKIRERLFQDGYDTPLVADIHFQPGVAMMVAEAFEKIRINPGNFADGRKSFAEINYDDPAQFDRERESMAETFLPLVEKCKRLGRAMRIGTNHGSLSARILSYYGDTPRGMVESAFEFADMCRGVGYHNFLFSMKASNPLVMVSAYRLLSEEMGARGWDYPLHLGVTEAGEGEDGRMKSAIGIGALLMDGLGDTIRVSLTEDPELEIGPCSALAALGGLATSEAWGVPAFEEHRDTHAFARRTGRLPEQRDGDALDYRSVLHRDGSVLCTVTGEQLASAAGAESLYRALGCKLAVGMPLKDIATADSVVLQGDVPTGAGARRALRRLQEAGVHVLADAGALGANPLPGAVAVAPLAAALEPGFALPVGSERLAVSLDGSETPEQLAAMRSLRPVLALLAVAPGVSRVHAARRVFESLRMVGDDTPVIHAMRFDPGTSREDLVLQAGAMIGALMVDGLGDGVMLSCPTEDTSFLRTTAFGLLQGVRMRNTKTEYVSCPSCGRTLFDLQDVTDQIRQRTGHLPGVAIAVMGCIVNGPGEMADADFGYVGGAPGKIDLYVGKEVIRRGIPMDGACDQLIELIKEHGRWKDPEPEEAVEQREAAAMA